MPDQTNLPQKKTPVDVMAVVTRSYPFVSIDEMEGMSLQRTLAASTATAVLAEPESHALDEMTGEPFWLQGIDFFTFSQVKGHEADLYAYLNCYWDNGAGFTVTTGSPFVITRVHRLAELQVLPRRVMSILVESKRNQGQASLWIVEAPLVTGNGPVSIIETVAEAL
jgi:hypothetical protein